jgi:hypothetical protein
VIVATDRSPCEYVPAFAAARCVAIRESFRWARGRRANSLMGRSRSSRTRVEPAACRRTGRSWRFGAARPWRFTNPTLQISGSLSVQTTAIAPIIEAGKTRFSGRFTRTTYRCLR